MPTTHPTFESYEIDGPIVPMLLRPHATIKIFVYKIYSEMKKIKPLFGLSGERGGMDVVMRSKRGDQWVPPWGCRARARVRPPLECF